MDQLEKKSSIWKYDGGAWEQQIRSARMILSSLLKTHGRILTDESLLTLLVEMEAIFNSPPLITETINDVTSLIPLSPIKLKMKSKSAMPPPGVFASPDKRCRKYWRTCNIFAMSFGTGEGRGAIKSSIPTKLNNPTRNCKVGHIVLLKNEADRNQWSMAKIVATNKDDKGDVRSVKLLTSTSDADRNTVRYLERPVNKLVMLIESND